MVEYLVTDKEGNRLTDKEDIISKGFKVHIIKKDDKGNILEDILCLLKRTNKMEQIISKVYKEVRETIPNRKNKEIRKAGIMEMVSWALNNLFSYKFAKLTRLESKSIKNILVDGFKKGESRDQIMRQLKRDKPHIADKLTGDDIERIIRTETSALRNKAREKAYMELEEEEEEKYKYKWIAGNDERTTIACRELEEETKNGVYLEDLKRMVEEKSRKYYPKMKYTRDFLTHINCRCSFSKVID